MRRARDHRVDRDTRARRPPRPAQRARSPSATHGVQLRRTARACHRATHGAARPKIVCGDRLHSNRFDILDENGCGVQDVAGVGVSGIPGADLGWSLGVVLRGWHEHVEAAVEGLPNGLRGYQILSVISRVDPPTQVSLARHLNIDKTVMPYVVDALAAEGLLERRVDPADRRLRRIAITEHGAAVLGDLQKKVAAAEDQVFQGFSAEERSAVVSLVERLAVSIHSNRPYIDPCMAVIDVLAEQPAARR